MKKRSAPRRRLMVEGLETRRVFDVSLGLDIEAGLLTLQGDGDSEHVVISEQFNGALRVESLNGNFQGDNTAVRVFNASQIDEIDVRLGNGNDIVQVRDISSGAVDSLQILSYDSTSGNVQVFVDNADIDSYLGIYGTPEGDAVSVKDSSLGMLDVWTANGDDVVDIDNVTSEQTAYVGTGIYGDDVVEITDSDFNGALYITTYEGRDEVTVSQVEVYEWMDVDLGNGPIDNASRQVLNVYSVDTGKNMDIDTGGGAIVTIQDAWVGTRQTSGYWDLTIDTAHGWDAITINSTEVDDDLRINTNNGSDNIDLSAVKVGDDLVIDAGEYSDTIELLSVDADDVSIYGRGGSDTVRLSDVDVVDRLYARLGSGNDTWDFNGGNSYGRAYVSGDSGTRDDFQGWMWGATIYGFER